MNNHFSDDRKQNNALDTDNEVNADVDNDTSNAQPTRVDANTINTNDINTSAEADEINQLKAQIEQLQKDARDAKEAQARANAESYNAQKRMENEAEKAKKYALQKFVKELLDVVDNLERAIATTENTADNQSKNSSNALLEGVVLTHKSLLAVLERHGVQVVNPVGEKFDPEHHEAVGIAPDADTDMVGQVLQKGYVLNGRSIRPAMVTVGQ